MTRQTNTLVSHSICGKRKAGEAEISSRISTKVVDGETWTTFYYSNNHPKFWRNIERNHWKSVVSSSLLKNSANSMIEVNKKPRKRLHKGKERANDEHKPQLYKSSAGSNASPEKQCIKESTLITKAKEIEISKSADNFAALTDPESEEKVHKIKFWSSKRIRGSDEPSALQEEANRQRSPKKHRIRRWLNKESPEAILAQRIKKARYDFSVSAAEAAMVAAVRNRAKKIAKAGAFAAAAFARVVAEEVSTNASHGSIADTIIEACKDVARTSLVQRAKNGDYLILHQLFHYHFKFRGPNYYKPLEPCCYYITKSGSEPVIHCKMDEPIETFRSSAIAKDSPLVLFLKQVAEEGDAKAQADADTISVVHSNVQTNSQGTAPPVLAKVKEEILSARTKAEDSNRPHSKQQTNESPILGGHSEVPTIVKVQLDDFFSVKSGDIGWDVRTQAVPLKPTVKCHKGNRDVGYSTDRESILTPIKHFLETLNLHSTFDENINLDGERGRTAPRAVSKSIWQEKTFEPTSQFRVGSQYLSMRTSSVGMVR
ncbi:hypothetical protein ZYGR_0AK04160 [Zygosaccharomyces rouxii]|uniref:Uncharacterized protein n=1 Tax=Zygosaccharomyces rouxii TaxID=4956 RepID=A0A1Q3ADU4_ZYGRO|nr:hypothetical protein ZYGR_0AK04160 [Zygosaccharomyces rouxii]